MSQKHSAATISFQSQCIKSISVTKIYYNNILQKIYFDNDILIIFDRLLYLINIYNIYDKYGNIPKK